MKNFTSKAATALGLGLLLVAFQNCSGGFSAIHQVAQLSSQSVPDSTTSPVTIATPASSATPAAGATPGSTPAASGRNYLVGVFQDANDTTTQTQLGYKFDYTLNGSYQDNCVGCGVSGLAGNAGYPVIVDVHHVQSTYPDFNAAAAGTYNASYDQIAQSLANSSSEIYAVRIDSEFNGAWSVDSPWQNNYNYTNGIAPATWIAGWRNLATSIHKYLPNAKIIWNPNTGQGNALAYYPGDDLVDLIGIDAYTFTQYFPTSAASTADQMSGGWGNIVGTAALAKQHGKPMGFPEWGDTYGDGVFVTAMGAFINDSSNNVVFHAFWDSNQAVTGSSRLADHPANQAAFVKAFSGKSYTGSYWTFKAVP